jgi:hypothetical protein
MKKDTSLTVHAASEMGSSPVHSPAEQLQAYLEGGRGRCILSCSMPVHDGEQLLISAFGCSAWLMLSQSTDKLTDAYVFGNAVSYCRLPPNLTNSNRVQLHRNDAANSSLGSSASLRPINLCTAPDTQQAQRPDSDGRLPGGAECGRLH